MICQNCKSQTATILLTESLNGKVTNLNLCKACSHQFENKIIEKINKAMTKFEMDFETNIPPEHLERTIEMMSNPFKILSQVFGVNIPNKVDNTTPTELEQIHTLKHRIQEYQKAETSAVKAENFLEAAEMKKKKDHFITELLKRTAIRKIPLEDENL